MLSWKSTGDQKQPALILLHGFMGSGDDWNSLVSLLKNDFFLITVDLPGHGESVWQTSDVQGSDVQDVEAFCRRFTLTVENIAQTLGVDLHRFRLMGYSLGGRLAMSYGIRHPETIHKLILEGAHTGLLTEQEKQQRKVSDERWAKRFVHEPINTVLYDWYQQPVFAALSENQVSYLIQQRAGSGSHIRGEQLAQALSAYSLSRQPNYRTTLALQPFPVHYVYGENDRKFALLAQQLLADRVVTTANAVADSGHNIHWERPEALARLIKTL